MLVLSAGVEGLVKHAPEVLEMLGFQAVQGIHVLVGQLEGQILFQLHAFSWEVAHEEAIIDMKQTSIFLYHNVSIVSVFDLQEIGHQTISGESIDEVFTLSFGIKDGLNCFAFFLELVDGYCISDAFHNP